MKTFGAALVVALLFQGGALADTKSAGGSKKPSAARESDAMPKTPELQRFAALVGTWHTTGSMMKSPMGPGGKMEGTTTCSWFEGGFFLECHSDDSGAMGKNRGIEMFGYDANKKTYTYSAFASNGMHQESRGKVEGNTWTWTSEENMGGKKMKGRFVVIEESPDKNTMSWSISPDGKTWSELFKGEWTRAKSAEKATKAPAKKK
jgi:Protein of unknown function (DUF1579)